MTREMPAISAAALNVGSGGVTWQSGVSAPSVPAQLEIDLHSMPASVNEPAMRFSVSLKASLPVNSARIRADAPLTVLWPDGYPGNGGVTKIAGENGRHSLP